VDVIGHDDEAVESAFGCVEMKACLDDQISGGVWKAPAMMEKVAKIAWPVP